MCINFLLANKKYLMYKSYLISINLFDPFDEMYRRICHLLIRRISIFRPVHAKNFYECLEIRQAATQADIKEAYYRLSMKYHPDRNKGEEAAVRFRKITEAYEVLRNVRLRKLYDKGLNLNQSHCILQEEEINKFYTSRQFRSKPPPPTGRTPVYDFDEWSRSHYGATLARDLARKKRRQQEEASRIEHIDNVKKEKVMFCAVVLTCLAGYLYLRNEGYDEVKQMTSKRK